MRKFTGPRWPTERQSLLLRASLLEAGEALAAWDAWREEATLDDDIDFTSWQLLPLLYRNLERHGQVDADMGRLKGIYRRTWYLNLQKLHRARVAFGALHEAGIPTMALKGIVLLVEYYRDYGVRPMQDIDLMVPVERAREAAATLHAHGWKAALRPGDTIEWPLRARHGVAFGDDEGSELDLHWHMLEERCGRADDDETWARATPLAFEGVETSAPSAAYVLEHVIVHGARYSPAPSLRWLADAYVVVASGRVDWDFLVEDASRGLSEPLFEALHYLRQELGAGIPRGVLPALRQARRSPLERLDYRAQGATPTIAWAITRDLTRYVRLSTAWPLHQRLTNAPHYFAEHYEAGSAWALPREGFERVYRRAKQNGFRVWRPVLPR